MTARARASWAGRGSSSPDRFEVFSAGVNPSRVRPEAVEAMREIGIDISGHRSKSADEFVGQDFDYITVCDNARETCPVFPGRLKNEPPAHPECRGPSPGRLPETAPRALR